MEPVRRHRHPLFRAIFFGVAAVYTFALGVYGAMAIPHGRRFILDDFAPRGGHVIWLEDPNNRIGLRILCLVAGFAAGLVLARATNVHRFRRERLGLRAF